MTTETSVQFSFHFFPFFVSRICFSKISSITPNTITLFCKNFRQSRIHSVGLPARTSLLPEPPPAGSGTPPPIPRRHSATPAVRKIQMSSLFQLIPDSGLIDTLFHACRLNQELKNSVGYFCRQKMEIFCVFFFFLA